MKKGWKKFWIGSGIVFGAGTVLCLTSLGLGFSAEKLAKVYPQGISDGIGIVENHVSSALYEDWDGSWDEEVSAQGGIRKGSFAEEFDGVDSLDLEMAGGDLQIKPYEGSQVRVEGENINEKLKLRNYKEGGIVCIRTSAKVLKANGLDGEAAGTVTVYVPEDTRFTDISVKIGGGSLKAGKLETSELSLSVGAGDAKLEYMAAQETEIRCGTGAVSGILQGKGDIEVSCGVGRIALQIEGSEHHYNEEISCGIGNVRIGDRSYSGLGKDYTKERGASRELSVSCGVGTIELDFSDWQEE